MVVNHSLALGGQMPKSSRPGTSAELTSHHCRFGRISQPDVAAWRAVGPLLLPPCPAVKPRIFQVGRAQWVAMTTQPYEPYPPHPQEPAAREAELPPVRWGLLHAIGSLAGFALATFAVSFLLKLAGADPVVSTVGATLVGWLSLAGWPLLVSRKLGNGPRSDLALRFQWVDIGYGLLAAFVVLCSAVIFVILYQMITGEMPTSALGNVAANSTASWQVIALIVLALGAPFVEELHFRGMWWSALSRRGLPGWLVLVITSALFALVHLEPTRFLILLAAGLAAGAVRLVTGRLGPSIVTHLLINAIASVGLLALL